MEHPPLNYIFSPRSILNTHICRWQIKLQGYDFNVVCKKLSTNIAGCLSQKCKIDDDSSIPDILFYLNRLSKMKVHKAMSLEQVMNEG